MQKFRVEFNLPSHTEYQVEAAYPEAAKREAAKLHRKFLPKLSIAELSLVAHCYRVEPKSQGRSYKNETFIEEMYKKYYNRLRHD